MILTPNSEYPKATVGTPTTEKVNTFTKTVTNRVAVPTFCTASCVGIPQNRGKWIDRLDVEYVLFLAEVSAVKVHIERHGLKIEVINYVADSLNGDADFVSRIYAKSIRDHYESLQKRVFRDANCDVIRSDMTVILWSKTCSYPRWRRLEKAKIVHPTSSNPIGEEKLDIDLY